MNWSAKLFSRGTASWCCPSGAARGWQRCSRRGVPTNGEFLAGETSKWWFDMIWWSEFGDLITKPYMGIHGESQESKLHGITGGMNTIAASYLGVKEGHQELGGQLFQTWPSQVCRHQMGFAFLFTRIISKTEFRVANYTICTCMRVSCIYCIERHTYVWP